MECRHASSMLRGPKWTETELAEYKGEVEMHTSVSGINVFFARVPVHDMKSGTITGEGSFVTIDSCEPSKFDEVFKLIKNIAERHSDDIESLVIPELPPLIDSSDFVRLIQENLNTVPIVLDTSVPILPTDKMRKPSLPIGPRLFYDLSRTDSRDVIVRFKGCVDAPTSARIKDMSYSVNIMTGLDFLTNTASNPDMLRISHVVPLQQTEEEEEAYEYDYPSDYDEWMTEEHDGDADESNLGEDLQENASALNVDHISSSLGGVATSRISDIGSPSYTPSCHNTHVDEDTSYPAPIPSYRDQLIPNEDSYDPDIAAAIEASQTNVYMPTVEVCGRAFTNEEYEQLLRDAEELGTDIETLVLMQYI
jgi:hypothetical protein